MNRKIMTIPGALVLSGVLLATSADAAGPPNAARDGLVGTWMVEVTLRNCETNAPLHVDNALMSFHRGGTISESARGAAFAPGQRGAGHGSWVHTGAHTYSQTL